MPPGVLVQHGLRADTGLGLLTVSISDNWHATATVLEASHIRMTERKRKGAETSFHSLDASSGRKQA